jgi:hypothetical protein
MEFGQGCGCRTYDAAILAGPASGSSRGLLLVASLKCFAAI